MKLVKLAKVILYYFQRIVLFFIIEDKNFKILLIATFSIFNLVEKWKIKYMVERE